MKVLFICEGNMMRSQMAEAFYNRMTESNDAKSAGAIAEDGDHISIRAIGVMNEVGLDMTTRKPKQVTEAMAKSAETIVYFPSDFMPEHIIQSPKAIFWDVADPHYHKDKGMDFVRAVRDDIQARVNNLV